MIETINQKQQQAHKTVIDGLKAGWEIDQLGDEALREFMYTFDDYCGTSSLFRHLSLGTAWECDYLSTPRLLTLEDTAMTIDNALIWTSLPQRLPLEPKK